MRATIFSLYGLAVIGTANGQALVVHNVAVVSAERSAILRNADVVIEAGHIVSVGPHSSRSHPPKAQRVDGSGLHLAPGLIDAHVHLGQTPGMSYEQETTHRDIVEAARAQFPRSYLYFGFTTIVDLNSPLQAITRWNAQPLRPDTYFCGAAPIIDGYPMAFVPKPIRYRMPYFLVDPTNRSELPAGVDPTAHTPAAVIARMKRDGAICAKTHFERGFGDIGQKLPVPRVELIRDLIKEAHAAGMPVFLHANSAEAQAFGLQAGVDIMAHGIWKWGGDGSRELPSNVTGILDRVIRSKVGWQPTIQVLYGERDVFGNAFLQDARLAAAVPASLLAWYRTEEGKWFRNSIADHANISRDAPAQDVDQQPIERVNLATKYLADHDARFLFGSDTPSDDTYANPHGLNGRIEMQRLVDAGLSAKQIFRAATLSNAEALHLEKEIGSIEKGKRANLLLLRGDPTEDINAFDRIEKVILNGKVLERSALAANGEVK